MIRCANRPAQSKDRVVVRVAAGFARDLLTLIDTKIPQAVSAVTVLRPRVIYKQAQPFFNFFMLLDLQPLTFFATLNQHRFIPTCTDLIGRALAAFHVLGAMR
jgi:hypothetical protein